MDRAALERRGFVGWPPLLGLDHGAVPEAAGVYAVAYGAGKPARWPNVSCGGWFKGKDPSVDVATLEANWVVGAEIVYFGQSSGLRKRLKDFSRFGSGKPVGHWGGRLIWQLPDPASLRVGWLGTGEANPLAVEAGLIADFRTEFGKPPFANNPDRLGR